MKNLTKKKINALTKRKKKGFTLVELIIVIAIIAILAAIAVPKFSQITRNANIRADVASAKTIHEAASQALAEDPTTTAANITAHTQARLSGQQLPTPRAVANQAFVVTMDDQQNITVTVNGVEVFPNTNANYGN